METAIDPKAPNHPGGGLIGYFAANRTLDTYPAGTYRWKLLALTFFATVLCYYELSFTGLIPLWMATLHFGMAQFAYFITFAILLAGIASMFGGPLADRHGRVIVIDFGTGAILVLTFCNLFMTDFWSFVLVRSLMCVAGGFVLSALPGLTRDLSPRVGRASAFAIFALGAVGSNWLWTIIPGVTLPYLHTWQSQIWILGIFGIFLYVPVVLWLKDLSPALRQSVVQSEASAAAEGRAVASTGAARKSAITMYGELLRHWQVWALVLGAVFSLALVITMQTFGTIMYIQLFKYTPAEAARVASYWFLISAIAYPPSGYLSDFFRVRKVITVGGAAVMLVVAVWWVGTFAHPLSPGAMSLINIVLAGSFTASQVSWMALYSEYLEDLAPSLQATGWGFFNLVFRIGFATYGLVMQRVAQNYGWVTWIWMVIFMIVGYLATLLMVRGYWRVGSVPVAAEAASARGLATNP